MIDIDEYLLHEIRVPGMGQRRYLESSRTSGASMCALRVCCRGVRMYTYGRVKRVEW
jgi:hypothetical protein